MGILNNIMKRRTAAQKEIRSAQSRARQEVKESARSHNRREKLLTDLEKQLLKKEQKGLKAKRKHERKLAKQEYEKIQAQKLGPARVAGWIGAARVALPVLLPLIYRGVTAGREQLVNARANKAGLTADQLAQYSGHGAAQKARLDGIRAQLQDSKLPAGYRRDAEARIEELVVAANNAEFMSPEQRSRALSAVNRDIDKLTQDIQTKTAEQR